MIEKWRGYTTEIVNISATKSPGELKSKPNHCLDTYDTLCKTYDNSDLFRARILMRTLDISSYRTSTAYFVTYVTIRGTMNYVHEKSSCFSLFFLFPSLCVCFNTKIHKKIYQMFVLWRFP